MSKPRSKKESYWKNDHTIEICKRNLKSIEFINKNCKIPFNIIDKCSIGNGWNEEKYGVGWARKLIFQQISAQEQIILEVIKHLHS